MARYPKQGLDYFPMPIKRSRAIKLLSGHFGYKGEIIHDRLLSFVYEQKGYYAEWTESARAMFIEQNSRFPFVNPGIVKEVIDMCLKINVFNRLIFEKFSVLTSAEIQHTWIMATRKRTQRTIIAEYWITENFNGAEEAELIKEEFSLQKGNKIKVISLNTAPVEISNQTIEPTADAVEPEVIQNFETIALVQRTKGSTYAQALINACNIENLDEEQLWRLFDRFVSQQILQNPEPTTESGFNKHLINWLNKYNQLKTTQDERPKNPQPSAPRRDYSNGGKYGTTDSAKSSLLERLASGDQTSGDS